MSSNIDNPVIMTDDEMALAIQKLSTDSYNEGALKMINAVIDTFRELGFDEKVVGRQYSTIEIVDILKGIRGIAESEDKYHGK